MQSDTNAGVAGILWERALWLGLRPKDSVRQKGLGVLGKFLT